MFKTKLQSAVNYFRTLFQRRHHGATDFIFAPAYDDATRAMAGWISAMGIEKAQSFLGNDAKHQRAVELIDDGGHEGRILMFVGHGKAAGLLTKPDLGKADSSICTDEHGCLLDTEDIKATWRRLHVIAWSCQTGLYFGPSIGAHKDCAFLGFSGPLSVVINHNESVEQIWKPVMRDLFMRIMAKRGIESHDAEWLKLELLALRQKIKNGTLDTGLHNRANSLFLKAAAKQAVVHISKG